MSTKIQATKNYRLFHRKVDDNRPLDLKKHKRLFESMKLYGFLECFPIVCYRENGSLYVKDGQHRLAVAESLEQTVHWVEAKKDFDVATVNDTQKIWQLQDYAKRFAGAGNKAYAAGITFAQTHRLSLGIAFALLGGTTSFGNVEDAFKSGDFKVKDEKWANDVASLFGPLRAMSTAPSFGSVRLLEACMAVCRLKEFDAKRLLANAERCREKLVTYGTRDAYLAMLEDVYNFGRQKRFALKIEAETVMRERNATVKAKAKKEASQKPAA